MKANITQRSEYVGALANSNGQARTMPFTISESKLKMSGLITVYGL